MKKFMLAALAGFLPTMMSAQITISSSDLASAGDTFRISNGMITSAIDPVPTGPNSTWDFSFLQPVSQDVDSFRTVASTGSTYALYFADVAFNSNRSNQAKKGELPVSGIPLGGVSITDIVSFFYKSSSEYRQTGYGASINGIGVPIGFNDKDRIYALPLNFSDTDVDDSDFSVSIPNLGYYGHQQTRETEVDGWGTLITPFGTFNTIRVKAVINSVDTLYADSLGFGFSIPSASTEYKWLAQNGGIPMLQINTTSSMFGGEVISAVIYRDSVRDLTSSIYELNPVSFNIFPNPASDLITVTAESQVSGKAELILYTTDGKKAGVLWTGTITPGKSRITAGLLPLNLPNGLYVAELRVGGNSTRSRLAIIRN